VLDDPATEAAKDRGALADADGGKNAGKRTRLSTEDFLSLWPPKELADLDVEVDDADYKTSRK